MPSGPPQHQIHGNVSTEARDGWYSFAEVNGTNVTSLLEAIGSHLGQLAAKGRPTTTPPFHDIVLEAQRTAARRSTRRRDDS